MVTRNRQREHENERHYSSPRFTERYPVMTAPLIGQVIQPSAPMLKPKPLPKPPAPKHIKKDSLGHHPGITRAQKATKQRDMKLEIGWYWKDYYQSLAEWRTVSNNYNFFHHDVDYCQDSEWWRHHYEKEYQGEIDPVEV